mgnify:FL=1
MCSSDLELPHQIRAVEAIQKAGGFLAEANPDKLNLAKKLKDGQRVLVPFKKTRSSKVASKQLNPIQQSVGKLNINTASRHDLMKIKGIGPKTAQNILSLRQKKGKFTQLNELLTIKGIGEKKLKILSKFITL